MNLAVIPARGGSKRIPRKNIREFCGKPIIAYSIAAARDAGCFDEVMVSTEDAEVATIARQHGAMVPFYRSTTTSSDFAPTADVVLEVIHEYRQRNREFTFVCCIYPTSPLLTPDVLRRGYDLLLADVTAPAAIPVTRFSYPIQRALQVEDGRLSLLHPEYALTRSQDLPPAYHDAGQFYWVRVSRFLEHPTLLVPGTAAIILPEWQVQDIDNPDDWLVAEVKYQLLRQRAQTT
jgi:pseudaminic acid cytidylyltransferase